MEGKMGWKWEKKSSKIDKSQEEAERETNEEREEEEMKDLMKWESNEERLERDCLMLKKVLLIRARLGERGIFLEG